MNVSFDSIRSRLATEFNGMAATKLNAEQIVIMTRMREIIGGLLCMYDPAIEDDCSDLSDSVELAQIEHASELRL